MKLVPSAKWSCVPIAAISHETRRLADANHWTLLFSAVLSREADDDIDFMDERWQYVSPNSLAMDDADVRS